MENVPNHQPVYIYDVHIYMLVSKPYEKHCVFRPAKKEYENIRVLQPIPGDDMCPNPALPASWILLLWEWYGSLLG